MLKEQITIITSKRLGKSNFKTYGFIYFITDQTIDAEDDISQRTDSMDSRRGRRGSPEKFISKSKSAIVSYSYGNQYT